MTSGFIASPTNWWRSRSESREMLWFYGYLMYVSHLASTWASCSTLQTLVNGASACCGRGRYHCWHFTAGEAEALKIDFLVIAWYICDKNWKVDLEFFFFDSTVKHRKSVLLAIKWWSFCENHLLERHEGEGSCLVCWYLRKSDSVACWKKHDFGVLVCKLY